MRLLDTIPCELLVVSGRRAGSPLWTGILRDLPGSPAMAPLGWRVELLASRNDGLVHFFVGEAVRPRQQPHRLTPKLQRIRRSRPPHHSAPLLGRRAKASRCPTRPGELHLTPSSAVCDVRPIAGHEPVGDGHNTPNGDKYPSHEQALAQNRDGRCRKVRGSLPRELCVGSCLCAPTAPGKCRRCRGRHFPRRVATVGCCAGGCAPVALRRRPSRCRRQYAQPAPTGGADATIRRAQPDRHHRPRHTR